MNKHKRKGTTIVKQVSASTMILFSQVLNKVTKRTHAIIKLPLLHNFTNKDKVRFCTDIQVLCSCFKICKCVYTCACVLFVCVCVCLCVKKVPLV